MLRSLVGSEMCIRDRFQIYGGAGGIRGDRDAGVAPSYQNYIDPTIDYGVSVVINGAGAGGGGGGGRSGAGESGANGQAGDYRELSIQQETAINYALQFDLGTGGSGALDGSNRHASGADAKALIRYR